MIKRLFRAILGREKIEIPRQTDSYHSLLNSKLIDIAHEVLAKDALEKQIALNSLTKYGWPYVKKQRFKERLRTRVRRLLRFPLTDMEEVEIVEEITERITEVAEVDPYLNQLFGDGEKRR